MQIVFIGGPSAGKTTIINMLRNEGFVVVDEVARQLLVEEEVPAPWLNRDAFQQEQLRRQLLAEEKTCHADATCFLDGGVFDGVAYYRQDGLPVPAVFNTIASGRYDLALLFEELPQFEADGVRYQDNDFSRQIKPVLEQCYLERGIKVAHVPVLPPEERLQFVLAQVQLVKDN